MTDSNATELLREMLDERGVVYETYDSESMTWWNTNHGAFVFFARERDGKLLVETSAGTEHSLICTPEQAVAATVGPCSFEELEADIWRSCDHLTMLNKGEMLVNVPWEKLHGWLASAAELNVKVDNCGFPRILISDGRLIRETLRKSGFEENWLMKQIRPWGGKIAEIFLLTVDDAGRVYCVRKEK